jgi:sugar phosphate isomerase/epimerase
MVQQLVVGMPTLIECRTIEQNVALCKEHGLQFIELNMNLPPYQLEHIDPAYYRNLMTDHGIFFTLHLPEELNIADANWRVREAWMQTVMDAIALAKALQMPILNMHMSTGAYFTMPAQRIYLFESYKEAYLKHIATFRERVADAIGKADICLAIENTGVYGLGFMTAAVEELLAQPCFGLTWDVGHDVVSGNQDAAFVTQHQHRLRHFHLHDVKNGKDHLPLGTGMVDLAQRLEMAKRQQCTCVLETKTIEGLRQSVAWMKKEVGCTTCDNG